MHDMQFMPCFIY